MGEWASAVSAFGDLSGTVSRTGVGKGRTVGMWEGGNMRKRTGLNFFCRLPSPSCLPSPDLCPLTSSAC
jgi:hypothetical protein